MEVSESSVAAPDVQTSPSEGSTGAESSPAAAENSESLKGAAVSVIQSPKKSNGVAQSERVPNGHSTEDQLTNGSEPQSDAAEKQPDSIEQLEKPGEQLPAELLQSDSSLTTVASLIEKSAEESENGAPPAPAAAAVPTVTPRKTTAAELADDWETDEPVSDAEMSAPAAASDNKDQSSADADKDQPAASDNKDQPAADKDQPAADASVVAATDEKSAEAPLTPATAETDESSPPRKSGRKVKPTEKVLEAAASAAGDVEESVEAIAKELATSNTPKSGKAAAAAKKTPAAKESEEEAGGEEKKSSAKKAGRPKKKDLDEKVDNVTKLGNNMYFYTGPGGQDSPPPLNSDEEGEKDSSARKSARAGKGRNPRLEREDEEVAIPTKVPPKANHNLNPNWLKTAAKNAEKDKKATTPVKKKSAAPQPDAAAVAVVAEAAAEVAEAMDTSENTASPAQPKSRTSKLPEQPPASPPKDDELPEFDPEKFTPGYTPKTVKKGNDEYMIVVEGVKDTGLCGKYWGDLSNLPSRRRSKQPEQLNVGTPDSSRQRRGSMSSTGSADSPAASKKAVKKADTPTAPKSAKKQVTKPETPKAANGEAAETTAGDETKPQVKAEDEKKETEKAKTPAGGRGGGRKRKVDSPAAAESGAKKQKSQSDESEQDGDSKEQVKKGKGKTAEPKVSSKNAAAVSAALAAGVPAGQQRSVSCVSDTSTQKEVVVECFAPYDDHRWVNIGKERDGMTPDAVQYARALRPPYHLLSFLRIKGHSTKGMSCTDKNTMVFVVLEGEITVILHTTQFNAKKGDSFYIPPKNYYNLINQKAREAELSLIQFQYDGPLPTVNPSTQ